METEDRNAELMKQLEQDITDWESQTVEFKKTATSDHELARAFAGLATANTGRIYVGVGDNRRTEGVDNVSTGSEKDKYQLRIARISRDMVKPAIRVKISFLMVKSKTVVRIDVPKGDEPVYYVDHKPYTRDLSTTRKLEPSEVQALSVRKYEQTRVRADFKDNRQMKAVIKRALINELSIIRRTLSEREKENRIPDERFPLITGAYDSFGIELASFLKPESLTAIQRTYEEIRKMNSGGRGHIVIAGSLDHIFQFTDFEKLISLIDDSISRLK